MALSISQISAASYPAILADARKPENQWADSAFMRELERQGALKKMSFGSNIEPTLDYQRNQSGDFLATDMTPVSMAKTEVISAGAYDIAELSFSVVWSKADEAKNPTENQKINLSASLAANGITSHDDMIEENLFGTSNDGFLGLQTIVPDSGQGTVGGINAALELFWRNHTDTYLDDASDIEAQMTEAFNHASKGSGSPLTPKLLVSGAEAQALFESTQQGNQRWMKGDDLDAGFKVLAFKNARYVFSQYGGTRIYFLNPKSFQLRVSAQYFRDKGETKELENVNGFAYKIYSALQTVTTNKSRLAVLTQTAA